MIVIKITVGNMGKHLTMNDKQRIIHLHIEGLSNSKIDPCFHPTVAKLNEESKE